MDIFAGVSFCGPMLIRQTDAAFYPTEINAGIITIVLSLPFDKEQVPSASLEA